MSMLDTESSLFVGGGLTEYEAVTAAPATTHQQLSSPFTDGFASPEESEREQRDLEVLLAELEDEGFAEVVDGLVNEVAGRHLMAASSWPDQQEADGVAEAETTAWTESFAESVDQSLAGFEARYEHRRVDSLTEEEVGALLSEYERDADSASEQFLGGLIKKAVKVAGSVARGAVSGLSRLMPLGKIFGLLRKVVRPLLRRVLAKAINRLPAALRGPAGQLASKLGLRESETDEVGALAEGFDTQFGELLLATSDAAQSEMLNEAELESQTSREDPLARLDQARARLARQLTEAEPGRPPTEQLEQFIPVVMAALPLIRVGVKIIGRGRIKGFLAKQLATLIQGYVGPQAARALAPHVADAGLRLLSLEAETSEQLGAEALVSTLEEAIAQVATLPAEALEDPLRLEAEIGDALAEAAVHHLPRELLREDLPGHESADEAGPWVPMPRAGRARRYRKCARRFDVNITRPQAHHIELPGADTLEERLLDAGVASWPVSAEVQLFEATFGTHLGHLAAGEGQDVIATEFEELSPANAGMLLGRPGLGSRTALSGQTGRRYFRLVVPGRKVVRPRSRIHLRLRAQQTRPELRVHVRLGERLAHHVSGLLARNSQAEVVALVARLLGPRVQESISTRLTRMLARGTGAAVQPARSQQLAAHIVEALKAGLAKQLPESAAALAAAAKDAAPGLTLTFAFSFADKQSLAGGMPGAPTLTVRPGVQND